MFVNSIVVVPKRGSVTLVITGTFKSSAIRFHAPYRGPANCRSFRRYRMRNARSAGDDAVHRSRRQRLALHICFGLRGASSACAHHLLPGGAIRCDGWGSGRTVKAVLFFASNS
jgi:hypothetical protein